MRLFYLSFASDTEFFGACVVRAEDVRGAHRKVTALGINPGGQMAAWDVTEHGIPPYPLNTLMTRAEMAAIDGGPGATLKEMSPEQQARVEAHLTGVVCEKHSPQPRQRSR